MSISTVANLDVYGSSMSYDLTFIADSIQHFEPNKHYQWNPACYILLDSVHFPLICPLFKNRLKYIPMP